MSCFRRQIAIKRSATPTIVDGYVVPGVLTDDIIYASVQPLKQEEVKNLPEGRRSRDPQYIFTDTFLNLADSQIKDFVLLNGESYEIEQRETWQNGVINHYKYLVIKVLES